MGINIKSLDAIAKYLETAVLQETKLFGGVKSILHTKPVNLGEIKVGELKVLKNDVFIHSNPFFCKMTEVENALLPKQLHNTKMGKTFTEIADKIRHSKNEQAFIVDETGKIIAKTEGNELSFTFSEEIMQDIKKLTDNKVNIGYIHNHPYGKTLSGPDISLFHQGGFSSVMATTPGNGYSFLHRSEPFSKIIYGDIGDIINHNQDLTSLVSCEAMVFAKLTRQGLSDFELVKNLNKFQHEQLKRFAANNKAYGYTYEYKPDNIITKNVPKLPSADVFKQSLIEQGITDEQAELFMKEIDKMPIKDFLLQA